jgi:hypothetical protein
MTGLEPLVVKYLLLPLGKGLYDRFFNKGTDKVADTILIALGRVAKSARGSPEAATAIKAATAELEQEGVDRKTAEKVVERFTAVAELTDEEQELHAFWAYMLFVLDSAAELKRPVALPGFLTGPDWLVVIDARLSSPDDTLWKPKDPMEGAWGSGLLKSTSVRFMPDPMPTKKERQKQPDGSVVRRDVTPALEITLLEEDRARIWFLNEPRAAARKAIVRKMEERFKDVVDVPEPADVAGYVAKETGKDVLLLDKLDNTFVYPYGAKRIPVDRKDLSGLDSVREALYEALDEKKSGHQRVMKGTATRPKPKPKPKSKT